MSKNEDQRRGELARKAVKREERIAFGLAWFTEECEADEYGALIRKAGVRYVGGYFDGKPCGREPEFDMTGDDGRKLYAVSR